MTLTNSTLPPEIRARLIRYDELIPCKSAFIDANTPGSDAKENFCLIGAGVAENPNQHVHISIAHGFDVGGARQPHGCKNSHHSHDTEEVFFVHAGQWKFTWGEHGQDGEVVLNTGDTISIPTGVFRGFENVGDDSGFLYAVLGLNKDGSAGHVTWAPYVYEQARAHGLVLLMDGRLIDTSSGAQVPVDGNIAEAPSLTELQRFKTLNSDEMQACVARADDDLAGGGLSGDGVRESAIIGLANKLERIDAGKMSWPHGFAVRQLNIAAGASIAAHTRAEEEVLFVHQGQLEITLPDARFVLHRGDVFTVPVGMTRAFAATAQPAHVVVVRRGDQPGAPQPAAPPATT